MGKLNMTEPLDFARDVWKEFELNKSKGAGMTYFVDGVMVKDHGAATNTDDLKEMPDSIVFHKRGKK